MSDVKKELDRIGTAIVKDAKANVPTDSGKLKKSIEYETNYISDEQFNIVITEKAYGQYVDKKTKYMTKAIDKNLDKGIKEIINIITDDILNPIKQIK